MNAMRVWEINAQMPEPAFGCDHVFGPRFLPNGSIFANVRRVDFFRGAGRTAEGNVCWRPSLD